MLHILTSGHNYQSLHHQELPVNRENDVFILTQDSVYAAIEDHKDHSLILSFSHCYVLEEDAEARGLIGLFSDKIQLVNYSLFVSLTQEYTPIITW